MSPRMYAPAMNNPSKPPCKTAAAAAATAVTQSSTNLTRKAAQTQYTKTHRPPPLNNNFRLYSSTLHLAARKSSPSFRSPGFRKSSPRPQPSRLKSDDDMTGLPQFCALCEKQIITPDHSILYCSESCRRSDGSKLFDASSASSYLDWQTPLTSRHDSYFDMRTCPDVVPKQAPTDFPSVPAYTPNQAFDTLSLCDRPDSRCGYVDSLACTDYGRRTYSNQSLPSLSPTLSSMAESADNSFMSGRSGPFASLSKRSIELVLPFVPSVESVDSEHLYMYAPKRTDMSWDSIKKYRTGKDASATVRA